MRPVFHRIAPLPASDGVFGDTQFKRQGRYGQRRRLDVSPSGRGGRGVLVQANVHDSGLRNPSINSRITARLTKSARREKSMQSSGTLQL